MWAIALTPDGQRAVTASEDFTARVWNVATGACEAVLLGHSGWVVDVAITAGGAHALTASHDATARFVPDESACCYRFSKQVKPGWGSVCAGYVQIRRGVFYEDVLMSNFSRMQGNDWPATVCSLWSESRHSGDVY